MLTASDAAALAKQHVAALPPLHAEYRIVLGGERELADAWYFDYRIEHVAGLPFKEWTEHFAGAPGFLVSKVDSEIHEVSWAEYRDRGLTTRSS